jgi:hypothetical protein
MGALLDGCIVELLNVELMNRCIESPERAA